MRSLEERHDGFTDHRTLARKTPEPRASSWDQLPDGPDEPGVGLGAPFE